MYSVSRCIFIVNNIFLTYVTHTRNVRNERYSYDMIEGELIYIQGDNSVKLCPFSEGIYNESICS